MAPGAAVPGVGSNTELDLRSYYELFITYELSITFRKFRFLLCLSCRSLFCGLLLYGSPLLTGAPRTATHFFGIDPINPKIGTPPGGGVVTFFHIRRKPQFTSRYLDNPSLNLYSWADVNNFKRTPLNLLLRLNRSH